MSSATRNYDLAVTARLSELPEQVSQGMLDHLQNSVPTPRGGDAAYRMGYQVGAQATRAALEKFITDADEITLGMTISPARRNLVLDLGIKARRGSELEKTFASLSQTPSRVSRLADSSAMMNVVVNLPIDKSQQRQILSLIPKPRGGGTALGPS